MALAPGTRFGSYEVVEQIGSGGMGEVWRATDTTLKRDVALKVLPKAFVEDADRLARFQREAEILASLNHANIATIHGLEKVDDQTIIVMELVEGPTLADRIKAGPLQPDEAMGIALQVIAALEAAHDKGIVHRDLKPANIKVRDDGTVKVLDFGISKPIDASTISGSAVGTTPAVTQTGVILGTAAYMSPEQARGKFVDQRTDIWAFGCLLFEMLTGQPAFGGEDVMLTLARVLANDTNLDSIPGTINPAVRRTIRLCLEKDPRKRIHHIGDVRLALHGTFDGESSGIAESSPKIPVFWRAVLPALTLLIGALAAGLIASSLSPSSEPPVVTRFDVVHDQSASFQNIQRDAVTISPDGRYLAYNAVGGLYVRPMDETEARVITGTGVGLTNPFFSPDSEWIGFWDVTEAQLKKVRVSGGTPISLAGTSNPFGASWTADDRIIFGQPQGIMSVSSNGGTPELLLASEEGQYWDAQMLPDGSVLYSEWANNLDVSIFIETPGAGDKTRLFAAERAIYVPTSHLLTTDISFPGMLFARSFDLATRKAGDPVTMEEEVLTANNRKSHFAVSHTGTLAYATGQPIQTEASILARVSRTGGVERLNVPPDQYRGPRISPDGTRLVVEIIGDNERGSIWIFDLVGDQSPRQLLGAGSNVRPIWTPDGEQITFASDRGGTWGIYRQAADGTGDVERLTAAAEGVEYWPDSWSPDARTLAFTRIDGNLNAIEDQQVWTVAIGDDGSAGEPEPLTMGPFQAGGASFSPNGEWIAYRDNGNGAQINVQPFPPTGQIFVVTDEGGAYPTWSSRGNELIYRRPSGGANLPLTLAVLEVTTGQNFAWGNEVEVSVPGGLASFGYRGFDFFPEGDEFVAVVSSVPPESAAAALPTIHVVTNWFSLVEERVPLE